MKVNLFEITLSINLIKLVISEGVEEICEYAFKNCSCLKEISIPESLSKDDFWYCSSITKITIRESVTEDSFPYLEDFRYGSSIIKTKNYKDLFQDLKRLKQIVIPENVKEIGKEAFKNCSNLKEITISEGVTKICEEAFSLCNGLNKIVIPHSVIEIEDWAFSGCRSLKEIKILEGVTKIGDWAFSYCSSLTYVNIPESVREIGKSIFWGCNSLTEIVIPISVEKIGFKILEDCEKLKCVYINENLNNVAIQNIFGKNIKYSILRTPQDVKDYLTNKMEKLNLSFDDTSANSEQLEKIHAAFTQDELTTKIIHDALHSIHEFENLISCEIE